MKEPDTIGSTYNSSIMTTSLVQTLVLIGFIAGGIASLACLAMTYLVVANKLSLTGNNIVNKKENEEQMERMKEVMNL